MGFSMSVMSAKLPGELQRMQTSDSTTSHAQEALRLLVQRHLLQFAAMNMAQMQDFPIQSSNQSSADLTQ